MTRVQGQLTRGFEPAGFAGTSARAELAISVDDGLGVQHFEDLLGCQREGDSCQAVTAIDHPFSVPILITPTQTRFQFDIRLTATAHNGGSADFSPTALQWLALPSGLSFSSDSGVFLSQAVPEPALSTLWLFGLALLAALRRRRQPTQVSSASHSGAVSTKPSVDSTMAVVASASKLR